jgi:hypothetical protein
MRYCSILHFFFKHWFFSDPLIQIVAGVRLRDRNFDQNERRWLIEDYSGRRYVVEKIPRYQTSCSKAKYFEDTCKGVFKSPLFSHCLKTAPLDTDRLLQKCVHDSCLADESPCAESACLETSCRDICNSSQYLRSPPCQLAWHIAEACRHGGMFLPDSWEKSVGCESTEVLRQTCSLRMWA